MISFWTNEAMISALADALEGITHASLTFQPALAMTVVGLTFAACVVATLWFGLAPALRASRRDA